MGNHRNSRGDKEYTRVQRMAHENKELKQEISRLRNTLSRIDYGWCPGCLGVKDSKEFVPDVEPMRSEEETRKIEKDRTCYKCQSAQLLMIRYSKANQEKYYCRRCPACGYRTKGKKLTPEVEE